MKILIVKTSSLGDLVQTFPAIGYLRNRFPKAEIDWVVEAPYASLVEAHPNINRAIAVQTKAWRQNMLALSTWQEMKANRCELRQSTYEVAFDLQGNLKSGLILSQVAAKHKVGFAKGSVPEWPNLLFTDQKYAPAPRTNIREEYLSLMQQYFGDRQPYLDKGITLQTTPAELTQIEEILSQRKIQDSAQVLVATGSAWRNKELPLATLKLLLEGIQQHLSCTFLFSHGSEAELQTAETLSACFPQISLVMPKLSLPVLQVLMQRLQLVIAMDSLPLHLAGTTSTPAYGFFGPSLAAKYRPLNSAAFQGICPYGRTFEKRCPILRTCPTGACLRAQSQQDLLRAFLDWWVQPRLKP